MIEKFLNSGYKMHELLPAKIKALSLDRQTILGLDTKPLIIDEQNINDKTPSTLNFVINQNPIIRSQISAILKNREADITLLLGPTKVILSEKGHRSTSKILFAKASFSAIHKPHNKDQKCRGKRCECCKIMDCDPSILSKIITTPQNPIKPDTRLDCKSSNVIYVFICKHCSNKLEITDFYLGRTMEKLHERVNGHRKHFKTQNFEYKKSALSLHTFEMHPEHFGEKLNNFSLSVIKSSRAQDLERAEDYFIWKTRADIIGLNRNKPVK